MRVKFSQDPNGVQYLGFICPGCGDHHAVCINGAARANWTWNDDLERPTLSPSILVTSGHYVTGFKKGEQKCWCDFNEEHPDWEGKAFKCYRCHSFVRAGRIEFLSDCTHELAGQTVDLFEIEES